MKKKELEYELRGAELAIRRLTNETFHLARECAKLDAALVERDAKISSLIDALTIATRAMAIAPEDVLT